MTNRLPIPGHDDGTWGSILNDFLDVSLNSDGTLQTSAISSSGGEVTSNKGIANGYAGLGSGGTVPISQLGTGVAGSSNFLRGDNIWAVPSTTLAADTDVSLTSPSNGQGLLYNSGSSKWTNQTLPTTADATTSSKGVVELANDLGGTAALPTVVSTHLSSALPVNQGGTGSTTQDFVDLTTSQSIGGTKTFSGEVIVPTPTNTTDAATKHYVDTTVASGAPNATTSTPGLVQLDGDLGGTATSPTVTGLQGNVIATTAPASGQVLTWVSGTSKWTPLAAPVTSVAGKTGAVTLVEGDVASLTGDLALKAPLASPALTGTPTAPTATGGTNTTQLATTAFVESALPTSLPPNGSAGGDLTGTYPNPTLSGTANVESIITANTTVAGALQKSGGTLTGTLTSQTITPSTTATYTLGDSSHYYTNVYSSVLNLSSTSSLSATKLTINGGASQTTDLINLQMGGNSIFEVVPVFNSDHYEPAIYVSASNGVAGSAGFRLATVNGTMRMLIAYSACFFQTDQPTFEFCGINGAYLTSAVFHSTTSQFDGNAIPTTNNTLNLGSSSNYWQYIYGSRLYLNSTAYLDGGTAGQAQLTGALVELNNAVTVSSNAATVPVTASLTTVTNNAAATATITITTTGAVDGQKVVVRFYDFTNVTQTLAWTNTENSSVLAPVLSNGSTSLPLTIAFQFNSQTTKWRCMAVA